MTITTTTRYLHWILDRLADKADVPAADVERIRKCLPEIPKQPTLEEIAAEVENASGYVTGNYWSPDISLKNWLDRLARDLNGLADESLKKGRPAHPALPECMRLADHAEFGRVVTSPKPDQDGVYILLVPRPKAGRGADWEYAHEAELTFIDAEPAKPAHPEFLETEADYENAPEGTIVAADKVGTAWIKTSETWHSTDGDRSVECPLLSVGTRRVLRWGWGDEK